MNVPEDTKRMLRWVLDLRDRVTALERKQTTEGATTLDGWVTIYDSHKYKRPGAISATATGVDTRTNDSPYDRTITAVRVKLDVAPATTSVIVDLKLNGSTIYTTTGNRPTLATGQTNVLAALPDVTAWGHGAALSTDIAQADTAATGLSVEVTYTYRASVEVAA